MIHTYSLELLRDTGIKFPSQKALGIFKKHGFRTDGEMVFFEEKDIQKFGALLKAAEKRIEQNKEPFTKKESQELSDIFKRAHLAVQ